MKVAAMIFGILGSFAIVLLGVLCIVNSNETRASNEEMKKSAADGNGTQAVPQPMKELQRSGRVGYVLVVLGHVSLIASFFVFNRARLSAVIMLLAVLLPAALSLKTLVFSCLLFIASVLAFLAKDKQSLPQDCSV